MAAVISVLTTPRQADRRGPRCATGHSGTEPALPVAACGADHPGGPGWDGTGDGAVGGAGGPAGSQGGAPAAVGPGRSGIRSGVRTVADRPGCGQTSSR